VRSDSKGATWKGVFRIRAAPSVIAVALAVSVAVAGAAPGVAAETTLIHAGRLIDPSDGSVKVSVDILVEGGRVRQVGAKLPVPAGAHEIDLGAYTVLPGLIDSHAHICLTPDYATRSPVLYKTNPLRALEGLRGATDDLMAGFTTLRDLDNEGADMADIAVRDAIDSGILTGPRLIVSGWALSITGGHMNLTGLRPSVDRRLDQLAIMADSPGQAVAAIRDQIKAGADFIKVYATGTMRHVDRESLEPLTQYSEEDLRAMVMEAARWGKEVAAHAYGGHGAYNAVAAGVHSIEHGMFLDDRTLNLMAEKGTWWVPTMAVYFPDESTKAGDRAFYERVVAAHRETFGRAMAKGVPHGSGWKELELMGEYGMEPMEVLRSATTRGAELLHRESELGRVAEGYLADIIAVEGRPDRDAKAYREVRFVMIGGEIVRHP
jgi:imidazolonepropionase-like amidohydrolase